MKVERSQKLGGKAWVHEFTFLKVNEAVCNVEIEADIVWAPEVMKR